VQSMTSASQCEVGRSVQEQLGVVVPASAATAGAGSSTVEGLLEGPLLGVEEPTEPEPADPEHPHSRSGTQVKLAPQSALAVHGRS